MTLATKSGSVDSLNESCRCGVRSNRFQIRPMVDFDSPVRLAIEARDQCVSWPGVDSKVATTTSSTWSSRIEGGRPGRGSSISPSKREATNRDRQRFTVAGAMPRSAATCLFVPPSAQASTIFARSAKNWALFARRAQRLNCARSASVRTSSGLRRPGPELSVSPAIRWAANRVGHLPTVAKAR